VTAERHGWVGSHFSLDRTPVDARIDIVREQVVSPPGVVRERFRKVRPLQELSTKERGWTLDVLTIVRRLEARGTGRGADTDSQLRPPSSCPSPPGEGSRGQTRLARVRLAAANPHAHGEFSNEDVYAFERELETLHPDNRHIRDKIRQQLQVLRDRGFLVHLGRNRWRMV